MIEAYLVGASPPSDPEGATDDDQDHRSPPEPGSLYLPAPVDPGPGALQPREHGAPISVELQSPRAGVACGADPGPRPRSGPVELDDPGRLQDPGQRCGDGPGGGGV